MYLGRIVAIGMNKAGKACAAYRVSSRSFPNREAVINKELVSVVPRSGFEADLRKNPYISYNAVRMAGDYAVVSNGSHTDPIAEKIALGLPVRDAFTLGLLAMDFEHDSLDTPRIIGAVSGKEPVGFLGIVRRDAVLVREFKLTPGMMFYISTYERHRPTKTQYDETFNAANADAAAQFVIDGGIFADFDHPVTSAAAMANAAGGFDLAVKLV